MRNRPGYLLFLHLAADGGCGGRWIAALAGTCRADCYDRVQTMTEKKRPLDEQKLYELAKQIAEWPNDVRLRG